jgi:ABC-type oligopeptide transport system ATPase subunit
MVVEQAPKTPSAGAGGDTIVRVDDIRMYFPVTSGIIFQRKVADVKAVDGVSFEI